MSRVATVGVVLAIAAAAVGSRLACAPGWKLQAMREVALHGLTRNGFGAERAAEFAKEYRKRNGEDPPEELLEAMRNGAPLFRPTDTEEVREFKQRFLDRQLDRLREPRRKKEEELRRRRAEMP